MGFLQEVDLGGSFSPFSTLKAHFGFVPSLFRCQSLLPRLIEAQAGLAASIFSHNRAVSRRQKERLLLVLAAANRNAYCATAHFQMLSLLGETEERLDQLLNNCRHADLPAADMALMEFAIRLCRDGPSVSRQEIVELAGHGWKSEAVLETILVTAWANFLAYLSTGVGASPDFEAVPIPAMALSPQARQDDPTVTGTRPYIDAPELPAEQFPPFVFLSEYAGLIPNVFRAQTLRPDLIEAEVESFRLCLFTGDHLTRLQKEQILLAVAALHRNAYFVAFHSAILGTLGMRPDHASRIAIDHHTAGLPEADALLLDFAAKLAGNPDAFGETDLAPLRGHGLTDEQMLEAVAVTSFAVFLSTLQFGLGAETDFASGPAFLHTTSKVANLLAAEARPTQCTPWLDPDSEAVARVQSGDIDAFEGLINRHSRRIYRTLVGILGDPEEARDAMQDTFFKAFQYLGTFQGRSRFSTWLVSIASNAGLQRLRERKHVQSLDDGGVETEEGLRPRQVRAWSDNPEQLCSKAELRALVEEHVLKLPAKYRVVVVLRDIEQLSIEEAAAALGVGIPALKTRHLRGRLMLREALTPHFAVSAKGGIA